MTHLETIATPKGDKDPIIEMFRCPRETCQRTAGVIYEPDGGMDEAQQSWVERIVGERGSFFPTDFTGSQGPRRY